MEFTKDHLVFSGHETFPLRQAWLYKIYHEASDNGGEEPLMVEKDLFRKEENIGKFGVGKNMLSSMRHWALAVGMLRESKNYPDHYLVDDLFDNLFRQDGYDRFLESPSSVWFIHWRLCSDPVRSTSWFWLFNRMSSASFTREDLVVSIKNFLSKVGFNVKASTTTLQRDVDTCIRSYSPRFDLKGGAEDASDSLLTELSLIKEENRGVYSFNRGIKPTLSLAMFCFALMDFWQRYHASSLHISFDQISYGDSSPGKVFKLDEGSLMDHIENLENFSRGALKWTSTAGVRQVTVDKKRMQLLITNDEHYWFNKIYEAEAVSA